MEQSRSRRNMFAHVVAHHQEKVARFLYDAFGERKDTNMVTATDEDQNNILHIAARLAPHSKLHSHLRCSFAVAKNELNYTGSSQWKALFHSSTNRKIKMVKLLPKHFINNTRIW
ncbi:hypothetical protein SLE2022_173950 [Rubroshorea leprosula]